MKKYLVLILGSILIMLEPEIVYTQITVSNFAEYQLGNLPNEEPTNLTSLYDQLRIEYYKDNIIIGLRYEAFNSSNLNNKYERFAQRYFEWQNDWLKLRVGNFYGIFGRGLIFRAFELPGVIQEDQIDRVRYGLTRDVDGFIIETDWKYLQLTFLRGESFNSGIAPIYEDRSLGIIEGGQLKINPVNWLSIGTAYVRYTPTNLPSFEAGSGFFRLSLEPFLQKISDDLLIDFYTEYAQKETRKNNFLSTSDKYAHALYFSTNFIYKNFGLSVEHKDYHNFNLQINDPVPAIREHSFYLLNRDTHVLLSEDEKGHQFEATYTLANGTAFIVNYSYAKNKPEFLRSTVFEEKYFETNVHLTENILLKLFIDKSRDEYFSKAIKNRFTGGAVLEWQFFDYNSINIDIEMQETKKMYDIVPGKNTYKDFYCSLGFSKASQFSLAIELQRTGDFEVTDNPDTEIITETKPGNLWAINANYQITDEHELFMFYGERRGGWACTAGTCYPVLPFKGMEVKLISRF